MSAASVVSDSATETMTVEEIVAAAKSLTAIELFKILKAFTTEAEKRSKSTATATKRVKKEKKEKGPVPTQLKKNHAWVAYTLKDAQENGWEEFIITKKDEEIVMPASTMNGDGAHVYEDTINDKTPNGRQINRSEAMSLAKVRKDASHSSWEEFEAQFVPDETVVSESSDDTKSTTSSKKTTTRKTAAEKDAERAEKKAAADAEKAEKKAKKDAEKAAKDAEKAEKKAASDKEKAEKKAAKEAGKKPVTPVAKASPVPAPKKAAGGAGAKASESESEASVAPKKPTKTATKVIVKAKAEEKIPTVEDDGQAHCVNWKGKTYYMMATGEAWEQKKDKSMGKWVGMFDAENNTLDTSAEEPVFDEE